jgi:hypothetical protein
LPERTAVQAHFDILSCATLNLELFP